MQVSRFTLIFAALTAVFTFALMAMPRFALTELPPLKATIMAPPESLVVDASIPEYKGVSIEKGETFGMEITDEPWVIADEATYMQEDEQYLFKRFVKRTPDLIVFEFTENDKQGFSFVANVRAGGKTFACSVLKKPTLYTLEQVETMVESCLSIKLK